MGTNRGRTWMLAAVACGCFLNSLQGEEQQSPSGPGASPTEVVPLFDANTRLEPNTTEHRSDALVTRVADRVRDRHAREPGAYDHYLSWYWQERTVTIELVDRVARGGDTIDVNITSLAPLNKPDFRCFFRGINTVAEYHHNAATRQVSPTRYTTTIRFNPREGRPLKVGDRMEFEFSPFLLAPQNGRKNYYGTTMLYIVGQGIVPWRGTGSRLDSEPLPAKALLGGRTTLSYSYSDEPRARFKQMAANMSPLGGQPFVLGRRLHHTDFGDGSHSERPNPSFSEHAGKLGPQYIGRSCISCHADNGRAMLPVINTPMLQTVVKVGGDANGSRHPELGNALQPQSVNNGNSTNARRAADTVIQGQYGDGTPYMLRKPNYQFAGNAPSYYSVRLSPQLVGLGLLEAIRESDILALADPDDRNQDGISGRPHVVRDPETGEQRMGRFGYKAGQARLSHQIAHAFNNDMGVTSALFPRLDDGSTSDNPEISADDLAHLTRYVATLGVNARRNLADEQALRGERLFAEAQCAKCHIPSLSTGPHHPLAELRDQEIQPYTDLLLHDLGPGLASNMGEGRAAGAEWRTAPLWNIGWTRGVSGGEAYLHDGRARDLAEAILWHGGEAEAAKEAFRTMPAVDRVALIEFLKSL